MFKSLRVRGWRQFADIDIEFHERLTVLTGANGAGKTSLLQILSRHFGWELNFVSTPKRTKSGLMKFIADRWPSKHEIDLVERLDVGELVYSDGQSSMLSVPAKVDEHYHLIIDCKQPTDGIFITSHRPVYLYKKVTSIPTEIKAKEQLLSGYLDDLKSRYKPDGRSKSASFKIKESLISLATFGYGNQAIIPNVEAIETFEGFQNVLRTVLPPSLGFQRIVVDPPEVVLETASGHFSFDAVSGGVASIIDMAWQLFMCRLVYGSFVAVIDEPENHLHPELQQLLLPKFVEAFPRCQFIVATHNPFMITSVPDSNVYVLTYDEKRTVRSKPLDFINKSGTANEILRDVLGLPFTVPIWVQEKLDALVEKYDQRSMTKQNIDELRMEMSSVGLGHLIPEAISRVVEQSDDKAQ